MFHDILPSVLSGFAGGVGIAMIGWMVHNTRIMRSHDKRLRMLTTLVEILLTTQERSQKSVEEVSQ